MKKELELESGRWNPEKEIAELLGQPSWWENKKIILEVGKILRLLGYNKSETRGFVSRLRAGEEDKMKKIICQGCGTECVPQIDEFLGGRDDLFSCPTCKDGWQEVDGHSLPCQEEAGEEGI